MKQFYFQEPVFGMWVKFFTECDVEDMMEAIDYDADSESSSWAIWLTIHEKWLPPAVWIKDKLDLPTVVHEISHAVHYIAESLWMKLTSETTEFFAYYSDFLFRCYQEWVLWFSWKIWVKFTQWEKMFVLSFTESEITRADAPLESFTKNDSNKKTKKSRSTKWNTKLQTWVWWWHEIKSE